MNFYELYLDNLSGYNNNVLITRKKIINLLNKLKIFNKSTIENFINKSQYEKIISPISKSVFWKIKKNDYNPDLKKDDIKLYKILTKNFPDINFTIWNTDFFNDFIQHTMPYYVTVIEADKNILEDVYYILNNSRKTVLINPSKEECNKYMFLKNTIVLKKEIKNMPTTIYKNIRVPKLEKILVDLFYEKNILQVYQGNEMINIYNSIFKKYIINTTTLLRYARNRGCREELISYIKNNINIPKQYNEVLK